MYSTCLFCNGDLGRNQAVEHFPVGRRLAFDAAKGRLWVVCRKCERWNLTPLEERWEAIEECERAFRETKLRVSTDQIGLARLKEGLELVRIGEPQRPEMAAWRYGDQFGRRRRKQYIIGGVAVAAVGAVIVAGPMLGIVGAGAFSPLTNLITTGTNLYRTKKVIHVPGANGETLRTRLVDLDKVQLTLEGDELALKLPVAAREKASFWTLSSGRQTRTLTGDDAVRAASALLPRVNHGGGSAADIQRAVGIAEQMTSPDVLFKRAAIDLKRRRRGFGNPARSEALKRVPLATRLALEMASHEESERRALEGELHILAEAWRQAEEIAGIADDMFVPESVDEELARLKSTGVRDGQPSSSG